MGNAWKETDRFHPHTYGTYDHTTSHVGEVFCPCEEDGVLVYMTVIKEQDDDVLVYMTVIKEQNDV